MPDGALPVLVLPTGASTAARDRTTRSLAQQSVAVSATCTLATLETHAHAFIALVLTGVELDATACERAVWFLATRPGVACVSGAAVATESAPPAMSSVAQFLVVRADVLRQILTPANTVSATTAIAVAIAVRQLTGRGPAWLTEPVIRVSADAAILAPIESEARAAMHSLGFDHAALVDMRPSALPTRPQQSLMQITTPALTARLSPAHGMRVLALLQGFPMGGYTAFNADLLPRLVAAGCAVTTCTTEWWRTEWRLDQVRAAAPDIHHAHATVPPTAVPSYIDWLITSRAIEVVLLSHSLLAFHMLPWLRARHPNVAFVDYVHTDWFETGMYGSYATMAAQWESQLDAQLATSDALVTQLVQRGCSVDAVRAAHIGIDTTAWQHTGPRMPEIRASIGASAETLVLLFSGRVSSEKRPHLAVDVAAQLRSEGHDAVLVVAGTGALLQATHERAVSKGIADRCKFVGELDEPTLRHVYAAADVFIAPSEIEGIARSLYEAMAMGCIPVVSDVGGQRELVVPGTGSLVDATRDDAALYVDGVRPFLHPAARAAASLAARAHVGAHFDSQRTVATVCDTLTLARTRRRDRQSLLPSAIAETLVMSAIEIIRRHVMRAAAR